MAPLTGRLKWKIHSKRFLNNWITSLEFFEIFCSFKHACTALGFNFSLINFARACKILVVSFSLEVTFKRRWTCSIPCLNSLLVSKCERRTLNTEQHSSKNSSIPKQTYNQCFPNSLFHFPFDWNDRHQFQSNYTLQLYSYLKKWNKRLLFIKVKT